MKPNDPSAPMFCLGLLPEHSELLARIHAQDGLYQPEARVLSSSLNSAITVASMPFTMAKGEVDSLRFQSLRASERIRTLKLDNVTDDERENIALNKARERMRAEIVDADASRLLAQNVVFRLNDLFSNLADGVEQLNSETLVMLWGAFEVFATDIIRKRLNLRPDEAVRLANEEPTKKRINLRNIPLGLLADFGFDLRERMGELILENANLASLEAIKDVLGALFPTDDSLRQAVGAIEMRRLWKRRNLVAHRRGVVDRAYQAAEVDDVRLGDRLIVGRAEIEAALDAVLKASHVILVALNNDTDASG
jgi:hypothetical protein